MLLALSTRSATSESDKLKLQKTITELEPRACKLIIAAAYQTACCCCCVVTEMWLTNRNYESSV